MNGGDEWIKEGFKEFEVPPDNGGREEPNRPGTPVDGGQHARQDGPLIQTSAEFVANFVPPDYLVDGLIQRRFVYAMTAPTSNGKTCIVLRLAAHVGLGWKLGDREVEQGKVLYLAGENPDDVRMRWIKLCEEMGVEPKDMPFLNEVDTNLVCIKEPTTPPIVQLHWRRKVRGIDFAPIPFELLYGKTERLTDSKGRLIWTVTARPISDEEQTNQEEQTRRYEEQVLVLMKEKPGLSLAEMAKALNWTYSNGEPHKTRVDRTLRKLQRQKFVKQDRDGWQLTKEGEKVAAETPAARAAECI